MKESVLQGKTVLLIGACGGMGCAAACCLSENGCTVIGIDREGASVPDGMRLLTADVTDPQAIGAACSTLRQEGVTLDAIVYMAGVYDADSLIEIDEARMRRIFEINVFGAYRTIRAFSPLLHAGSRVVLVTSELAPLDPLPFTGLYGITKSTLERYAFSLAMELQLLDISVSVIRPGAVQTPLLGGSVKRIEAFAANTEHYPDIAAKFLRVTNAVEAKAVPPEAVAKRIRTALTARRPRFCYKLNRNPLLLLYGILPKQWKLIAIKTYLK